MTFPEQIAHFEAFGFIVLRKAFSSDEMDAIGAEIDRILAADRDGKPFAGEDRQGVYGGVESSPVLRQLVDNDRIYEPVNAILGPDFIWQGSDINLFVGDTAWHGGGTWDEQLRGVKVALYLNFVQRDTGSLRVIPGSHRRPFNELLAPLKPDASVGNLMPFGLSPPEVPSVALESEPGDIVVFTESLWHSSFGGKTGRQMFTLNFLASPTTEQHLESVRRYYEMDLELMKEQQFSSRDWIYGEDFLNSNRPRICAMTSKLRELGLR